MDRVLDLLIKVKAEQDGSLSFRRSCGHGICGSDAMLINNRNRLACRIRVDQLGKKISVAPLPGLPVVKDLIVDMSGFFGKYRSVKPYLINDQPEPERERRQSPADRAKLRRHDQVHPVRRLHQLLPVVLGAAGVRRSGGDRPGPSLHLRLPRRGRGRAARDPLRRGRRLALPHDLQLRRRLPARHQHHQGDPRGLLGDRGATRLSGPKEIRIGTPGGTRSRRARSGEPGRRSGGR
jgi:hypothetical protein